jgi:REP element-mobilizing transposase RayT
MARSRRIKATGDAFYHITSRITGRQFLLKENRIKELMLDALERAARFSGVHLGSFCIMDDHFHLLCQVPGDDSATVTEDQLLDRLEALYGKKRADLYHDRWMILREKGEAQRVEDEQSRFRRRMNDLSQFVKTFKEVFRRGFSQEKEYSGRLWGDRFYSTLLESSDYLSTCAAYVEMNPVRAGLSETPQAYAWNTVGLAARGDAFAGACRDWLIRLQMSSQNGESPQEATGGDSPQAGWGRMRCAQIGKGRILGSAAFVNQATQDFADELGVRSARAREVTKGVFASHGYRSQKKRSACVA